MIPLIPIVTSIFSIGADWLKGRKELKAVELEGKIALSKAKTEATIALMANKQAADVAWENLSITNSGWKDEWFTILLSIPMVMCFIPGLDVYVEAGFNALNASTPEWYQWAFLVAVGSSFGVRKLTDFMSLRKGA